jgi:valyl-tRNA synthetase
VLWDVGFQTAVAQAELEDREVAGAWYGIKFHGPSGPVLIETTRPELLPACVALIAHPSDSRYQGLFGSTVTSPVFGAEVPVLAHPAAEPDRGTGIAMCCTFGDLADVQWWRELRLPTATIIGRDGRLLPDPPSGLSGPGLAAYSSLAGLRVRAARSRVAELLTESGDLVGEPRPTGRPVKFYEKGDQPLEIVSSRQWFIRSLRHQDALLGRGEQLRWHPEYMKVRYDDWVRGLTSDWLISRQRFFGVPFPVWYPLDDLGAPVYAAPILPSSDSDLPVDPQSAPAPGYSPSQRDVPGGFTGDPDVMDTWATSSLTPEIVCGWESDPELFAQTFPMDLRPQSHEIIRTWLFSTVLRSDLLFGSLPWRDVAISGWILDPDRKKMSKSKGNVVTPIDLLERFGSDGVRYWAASGRPGTDTAFDEGQMRVGRRLATKLLNASRFVLGFGSPSSAASVSAPLDLSMLAGLDSVVASATLALSDLEYTAALEVTERFFWSFCDDYLELVKQRAYAGDGSARLALQSALSVLQRLFAPFLPFCTEEAWSWWHDDSVHTAQWPTVADWAGDPDLLAAASSVMAAIRKTKSSAKRSMREPADMVVVGGPATVVESLGFAAADIRAAGNVASLVLSPSPAPDLTVSVSLAPQAQGPQPQGQ